MIFFVISGVIIIININLTFNMEKQNISAPKVQENSLVISSMMAKKSPCLERANVCEADFPTQLSLFNIRIKVINLNRPQPCLFFCLFAVLGVV